MEKASGKKLGKFFDYWFRGKDWPHYELAEVAVKKPAKSDDKCVVAGVVKRAGFESGTISITVETAKGEVTKDVNFASPEAKFEIEASASPERVIVNKYLDRAALGHSPFTVRSFWHDLPDTIIVYQADEQVAANRDAAEELQKLIRRRSANYTVPIRADRDLTDADWKDRHIIWIGYPHSDFGLPATFGPHSFQVEGSLFAHARSAVIAAGANPKSPNRSFVIVAGLGVDATRSAALQLVNLRHDSEVVVLPYGQGAWEMLAPASCRDCPKGQESK